MGINMIELKKQSDEHENEIYEFRYVNTIIEDLAFNIPDKVQNQNKTSSQRKCTKVIGKINDESMTWFFDTGSDVPCI